MASLLKWGWPIDQASTHSNRSPGGFKQRKSLAKATCGCPEGRNRVSKGQRKENWLNCCAKLHWEFQTKDYDDFANYWAFIQCSGDYGSSKEVHTNLDITFLEEEFGGRSDLEADADDAQADTLRVEMRKPDEKGTFSRGRWWGPSWPLHFVIASASFCNFISIFFFNF